MCLSDNGWTDNELGMKWFSEHFGPLSEKLHRTSKWRILIYDGHASHITCGVIRYCIEKNIILLCLPPHSTYKLQPLDVKVFSPLASYYRKGVVARCQYAATYNVDKIEFLDIYQDAREKAFTIKNIKSGWATAGLSPYNPDIVLETLSSTDLTTRPQTPVLSFTDHNKQHMSVPITPANILDVEALVNRVLIGEPNLDPAIVLQLVKLKKGASKAIANAQLQCLTTNTLLKAINAKKERSKQKNENLGYARVLN